MEEYNDILKQGSQLIDLYIATVLDKPSFALAAANLSQLEPRFLAVLSQLTNAIEKMYELASTFTLNTATAQIEHEAIPEKLVEDVAGENVTLAKILTGQDQKTSGTTTTTTPQQQQQQQQQQQTQISYQNLLFARIDNSQDKDDDYGKFEGASSPSKNQAISKPFSAPTAEQLKMFEKDLQLRQLITSLLFPDTDKATDNVRDGNSSSVVALKLPINKEQLEHTCSLWQHNIFLNEIFPSG